MSGLPIITADQRLAEKRHIKGVLLGEAGAGKTTQLLTLDPERTLFVDLEAGDLAVKGWGGDSLRPRTWGECRDLACFIGGVDPSLPPDKAFSQAHYTHVGKKFGDPQALDKYDTVFVDSITVASRLCMKWAEQQAEAMSERTGKLDTRAAYGILGREMVSWLVHLQHTRHKNVWFVGLLDKKVDDGETNWTPQIVGAKTALELPGIVDQVVTLRSELGEDGATTRQFICSSPNPFGVPAKDRSGQLAMLEPPHLGQLMEKISAGKTHSAPVFTQPNERSAA